MRLPCTKDVRWYVSSVDWQDFFQRMCQVLIGKIISGEMRVVALQLSSARFAERHSEAHRSYAVLVRPLMESKMIAGAPEHITVQRTQIGACTIGQGEGMAVVVTPSLSFGHFAGSEHGQGILPHFLRLRRFRQFGKQVFKAAGMIGAQQHGKMIPAADAPTPSAPLHPVSDHQTRTDSMEVYGSLALFSHIRRISSIRPQV